MASAFTLCHDFSVITELTHQMWKADKNIIKPDFLFPLFLVKGMIILKHISNMYGHICVYAYILYTLMDAENVHDQNSVECVPCLATALCK